jgi:uncharacterized protein YbaR (Trm112 family)
MDIISKKIEFVRCPYCKEGSVYVDFEQPYSGAPQSMTIPEPEHGTPYCRNCGFSPIPVILKRA